MPESPGTEMKEVPCPLCGNGGSTRVLQAGPWAIAQCRRCGLVYRNPRPSAGEFTPAAAGDALEAEEDRWLAERRAVNFRRFLDGLVGPPGKLLDVGCGYGWFIRMAKERGWEVVGVDVSPAAVRHARERLEVDARCGELRAFRFPEGAFSLVTLWNVLEVVPDPVGLLQEVHRVLRPGATLFIRTQNCLFQRLSFLLTGWLLRGARPNRTFVFHFNSFSPAPLRLILRRTGFVALGLANSPPTWGDPYRAFGGAERLVAAAKLGVHDLAQGLYFLSGRRWILGASMEAYARREE
jgi:SAM-dependent methyltransferase